MNSDPYDSAAWRTFGILDADESAIFDEAMRHDPVLSAAHLEMERISAAIAAASVIPVEPRSGHLDRIYSRLHLGTKRRNYLWLGITGWAAAAVLTLLLYIQPRVTPSANTTVGTNSGHVSGNPKPSTISQAPNTLPTEQNDAKDAGTPPDETAVATHIREQDVKATVKVATKRLVQEIEILRDDLEKFQNRDRVLFEAVPGMALPIVMRMNPPGLAQNDTPSLLKPDESAPITVLLGDALRLANAVENGEPVDAFNAATAVDPRTGSTPPTAIPIYDAARDTGTLVVSNLPPVEPGAAYHLWVSTANGDKPFYVGSLPESSANGSDTFDFSLGSNMVLPSGFILTKGTNNAPASPSGKNTVLQGPTSSTR
jgi:hypothetical protein